MTDRRDAVFIFPPVGIVPAPDPAFAPVRVEGRPYAVLIDDRLYAYGNTHNQALRVFRAQIAGGLAAARAAMWDRAVFVELSDDDASETAECIFADAIRWEPAP